MCPFIKKRKKKELPWSGSGILKGQNPLQGQHSQLPQEEGNQKPHVNTSVCESSATLTTENNATCCNSPSFIHAQLLAGCEPLAPQYRCSFGWDAKKKAIYSESCNESCGLLWQHSIESLPTHPLISHLLQGKKEEALHSDGSYL